MRGGKLTSIGDLWVSENVKIEDWFLKCCFFPLIFVPGMEEFCDVVKWDIGRGGELT